MAGNIAALSRMAGAAFVLAREGAFSLVDTEALPPGPRFAIHAARLLERRGVAAETRSERLTAALAGMLRRLALDAMDGLAAQAAAPAGYLARFKELLVADATVLRLHEWLSAAYAACRTNYSKAAAKLHV